jgi:antirestriction protein
MSKNIILLEEELAVVENSDGDSHTLPPEIVDAAIYCGITAENFEDAYCGKHESDKDFAYDQADQLGGLEEDMVWPYTCIDWDRAARELMYDYEEHKGHYFRSL